MEPSKRSVCHPVGFKLRQQNSMVYHIKALRAVNHNNNNNNNNNNYNNIQKPVTDWKWKLAKSGHKISIGWLSDDVNDPFRAFQKSIRLKLCRVDQKFWDSSRLLFFGVKSRQTQIVCRMDPKLLLRCRKYTERAPCAYRAVEACQQPVFSYFRRAMSG